MELQAGVTEVEAWAWQTGAEVVGVDKDKNQLLVVTSEGQEEADDSCIFCSIYLLLGGW